MTLPGGPLIIEWTAEDRILMTGPVEIEHQGIAQLAGLMPGDGDAGQRQIAGRPTTQQLDMRLDKLDSSQSKVSAPP